MSSALAVANKALLACARPTRFADSREQFSPLIEGPLEWPRVLGNARAQRVAALCFPAIQEMHGVAIPADITEAFRAEAMATAARNLQLAAKLLEINARAEQTGIPMVPYKGPVLAEMAYGNLGLREFVDLDFIVPHRHLHVAWNLLEKLGYRPRTPELAAIGAPVPGEYVFLSRENEVQVEVHTELTLRHFPVRPDLERLIARREPVALVGRRVLTFGREDTLTLLAVHGAKDFWAQLLWVCDIAALCCAPNFNWDQALERSRRMGCRRMVHVALLLARDLLEAPIPMEVHREAECDVTARRLAHWLAGRLFYPEPVGRWEQVRYRMRMLEGFWPGLRYAARLATTPAADDWNSVRLPGSLGFAYALLRPFRLLRR